MNQTLFSVMTRFCLKSKTRVENGESKRAVMSIF